MDYNNVNKRILELCKQRNWTEYRLSKESGIPNSSINAMIKHNHTPTILNLERICAAFKITISEFFDTDIFNSENKTQTFICLWNKLNPEDQERVLIYIHGLLHQNIEKDLNNDLR